MFRIRYTHGSTVQYITLLTVPNKINVKKPQQFSICGKGHMLIEIII
jgi:hypothetical protein